MISFFSFRFYVCASYNDVIYLGWVPARLRFLFLHSFIFRIVLILVKDALDREPIAWNIGWKNYL